MSNLKKVLLTPEEAKRMVEHNTLNRPLNDQQIKCLTTEIIEGKFTIVEPFIK